MITPARNIMNTLKDIGVTESLLINSIIITLTLLLLIACIVEYVGHKKKGDTHD